MIVPMKLFKGVPQRLGESGLQEIMGHAPHCFLTAIAIQRRSASIPIGNPVSAISNEDCFIAQIEQPCSFRQFSFILLSFLSFPNILKEIRNTNNRAVLVPNRINMHRNRRSASIRSFDDDVFVVNGDTRA